MAAQATNKIIKAFSLKDAVQVCAVA